MVTRVDMQGRRRHASVLYKLQFIIRLSIGMLYREGSRRVSVMSGGSRAVQPCASTTTLALDTDMLAHGLFHRVGGLFFAVYELRQIRCSQTHIMEQFLW